MVIKYNIGKNEYRNWIVGETDFQTEYLGKVETIFTLGNGYMGVRAATEETYREETRGCYIAGLFDKFPGEVTELANIPDWLNIEIKLDGEKFDLKTGKILSYQRQLNIKDGQLIWNQLWEQIDIVLDGPGFDQLAIRFSQFHIYQMTPVHDERLSIVAKGLSGEGYKGHVFWDMEIFILPSLIYTFPEIARRLLFYRYHFLDGAKEKAKENGFKGAMYPWECADTGCEVTPKWGGVDFKTGKPQRIWTGELEQHMLLCFYIFWVMIFLKRLNVLTGIIMNQRLFMTLH